MEDAEFNREQRGGASTGRHIPPFFFLSPSTVEAKSTRNGSEPHCDPPAHAGRDPSGAGGAVNVLESWTGVLPAASPNAGRERKKGEGDPGRLARGAESSALGAGWMTSRGPRFSISRSEVMVSSFNESLENSE